MPEVADDTLDLTALQEGFRDFIPHSRALGLALVAASRAPATATMRLPWDASLVGDPETGVLHGGVITTLVDATCGVAVFLGLRAPQPFATLDLRLDFFRAAEPRRDVFARAECLHATHNVAFVRAVAFHDTASAPFASAAATFMLATKGPPLERPPA